MVLRRKESRGKELPSAYRPICILKESNKLLERIIIKESLRRYGVRKYLVRVVSDYLWKKWVKYTDSTDTVRREQLRRGVPQESVLGSLFLNLGYGSVLCSVLLPECHVVCYADNTLVVAGGGDWGEALSRGETAVEAVLRSIHDIEVAANKTEAVFYYNRAWGPPPANVNLAMDAVRVGIKPNGTVPMTDPG
ncbi:hypothetical protein KM043_016494 [Ampulex compressa]|nr:hypothetical protein KM043_016494 [Ampulex compressa]